MGKPKPLGSYLPSVFKTFQGFDVVEFKENPETCHIELILEKQSSRTHHCAKCDHELGPQNSRYKVSARHLRIMGWSVSVVFWREKRQCFECDKVRSERIEFLCPTSPHVTLDLAFWLNRLTEITSVLAVSRLESVDKETCYRVDKHVLNQFMVNYKIPAVTKIAVDEVYARSNLQLKEHETRDDLFLTVIVDIQTHKVIWVSQSRRKEALDEFFQIIGKKACKKVKVVATDQHAGYGASVKQYCPQATLVWDRFHIVQKFNEALNEDRKSEHAAIDPESKKAEKLGDLMAGKYRYVFLTKAQNRSKTDQRHIDEVSKLNEKVAKLEIIKEHFHKIFDCDSKEEAQVMMADVYQWSQDAGAWNIFKWVRDIRDSKELWNYFKFKVTTGISEGINRAIKGLKWQAYGYKDMQYFALKILQKLGYLNTRSLFQKS